LGFSALPHLAFEQNTRLQPSDLHNAFEALTSDSPKWVLLSLQLNRVQAPYFPLAQHRADHTQCGLLSWDLAPLHRSHVSASGPRDCPKTLSFGVMLPNTTLLPSPWSLTTSTVCSAEPPTGLLHPACGHGVPIVAVRACPRTTCCQVPRSKLLRSR